MRKTAIIVGAVLAVVAAIVFPRHAYAAAHVAALIAFAKFVVWVYTSSARSIFIAETADDIATERISRSGSLTDAEVAAIYKDARRAAETLWESGR